MKTITEETYKNFVDKIKAKGVPAKVSLMPDGEIVVECGRDYPDKLFDTISDVAFEMDIYENLCVCAEYSGGIRLLSQHINGGPKAYYRW